jgi:hypothetical protein
MTNRRFERHFNTMIEKGWDVTAGAPDSVVDDNFGQFFIYWPHNKYLTMAAMSVDRYYQLIKDISTKDLPEIHDATAMAGMLCEMGMEGFSKKNKSTYNPEHLAMINACYMASTNTGKTYLSQSTGESFAFLTLMYPANKKCSHFSLRPSMLIGTDLLSVDDIHNFAGRVMQIDKDSGKKELFKYLKNK